MKKAYHKPLIEIERYELNASIAANCGRVISLGPEAPGKTICDEFKDAFEVFSAIPENTVLCLRMKNSLSNKGSETNYNRAKGTFVAILNYMPE